MTHIDIDAIASAARIALGDEEKNEYAREMNVILSFGELLCKEEAPCEVSLTDGRCREIKTALRADVPREGLSREALLAAAPTVADGYVTVPRVLSAENKKGGEAK